MKVYISCDIEGVAGLSSWEEARASQELYHQASGEMSLEAAACARGAIQAGADTVIVEDGHGDGRNIDISVLPSGTRLIRGITHDLFGVTGVFDQSFDALMFVGFHAAAAENGNPTSHTIVSSRVAALYVNGELWSEFEVSAYAAARIGVPVWFLSGDSSICNRAENRIAGVKTVATKQGVGYSVLSRTPADVQKDIEESAREALCAVQHPPVLTMPDTFAVAVDYIHHYDAKSAAHYPGAHLEGACRVCFQTNDYAEVMRFFYFTI